MWRHLPLNDVHPTAQLAAEASEAAAAQGKFWEMYDTLLAHQEALSMRDLVRYARELDLDIERFTDELRRREYTPRVSEDVASADESAVSGTPTFFINGRRHYGVYDINTLTERYAPPRTEPSSSSPPHQASAAQDWMVAQCGAGDPRGLVTPPMVESPHSRPGSRVSISCSSHPLPSGSSKEAHVK